MNADLMHGQAGVTAGIIDENLRNTKKDLTMSYTSLTTSEGYLILMDGKLDEGDRKPNVLDVPDYWYHNLHYHRIPSSPRNSLQDVHEEAMVDSCESQSSSFYQSLN